MTTTPDRIDAARALELLRMAVAQDGYGPDYVYPHTKEAPCQYVRDGAPSCLVGHALVLAGVALGQLHEIDASRGNSAEDLPGHLRRVTGDAAAVFQSAQTQQDEEQTWGVALAAAEYEARQFI